MRQNPKQRVIYILCVCCLLGLCFGCTFPGEVYISLSWQYDFDVPDAFFSCSVPYVPVDIADIQAGVYYFTNPGTYSLTYYYSDSPTPRTLEIVLKRDVTLLGAENAYYDVIISKLTPPVIYKVPAEP